MEVQSIVVDLGSQTVKAGFAGDDAPRALFPTIVGRPKNPNPIGMGNKDSYIGDEAYVKYSILNLSVPITRGMISNFTDLEKILHHTPYNELCIAPEEHPFLFTEHPLNLPAHRGKLAEFLIETFGVPSFYFLNQEILALYSYGRETGLVIQSGFGYSSVVPILKKDEKDNFASADKSNISILANWGW
eukprot:EC822422.1.p1 GENE.EC822422.1~~EC822422.1.p1  ORF type:complete len:188 (+),score=26.86 EC822422.1:20-583(+)